MTKHLYYSLLHTSEHFCLIQSPIIGIMLDIVFFFIRQAVGTAVAHLHTSYLTLCSTTVIQFKWVQIVLNIKKTRSLYYIISKFSKCDIHNYNIFWPPILTTNDVARAKLFFRARARVLAHAGKQAETGWSSHGCSLFQVCSTPAGLSSPLNMQTPNSSV